MSPSPAPRRPGRQAGSPRSSGRRLSDRLSLEDWTAAALDLLMREGVGAVKITRLCVELGVTKGSFYWHFADITDLKEAVAARWSALTDQALSGLADLDLLPPRDRLRRMTERLIDDGTWAVERAVRDWARTDEQVAASVVASDRRVFELVQQALRELGFTEDEARLRGGTLVYAGIGFVHGAESLPKPTMDDVDRILELLTEPERHAAGPAPSGGAG